LCNIPCRAHSNQEPYWSSRLPSCRCVLHSYYIPVRSKSEYEQRIRQNVRLVLRRRCCSSHPHMHQLQ
jgi:hypothetical protein